MGMSFMRLPALLVFYWSENCNPEVGAGSNSVMV